MDNIVIAIVAILSAASFVISYFQYRQIGFLFNNAYILASSTERKAMNKRPHYRQSAVVFFGIGIIFSLLTVEIIVQSGWLHYIVLGIVALLIVYAIISSIAIKQKYK